VRSQLVRKVSDGDCHGFPPRKTVAEPSGLGHDPKSPEDLGHVPPQDVVELIADRKVECVVNIPTRSADETVLTDGYRIRRAAADFGIPLINDAELARLFIRALLSHPRQSLDAKPLYAYAARSRPSGSGSPRS
jgi:hypothetical protein